MSAISIKQLLEAGVHFGHQTRSWNPKMKEYIFGERNNIHIINLQKTLILFREALGFVTEMAAEGKTILFVGTKRQAHEAIEEEARRCGMFYVTNRWLGGLLTNFETVQQSVKRYKDLGTKKETGFYDKLSKKEAAQLERERKKLDKNLRGIRDMERLPDALFIVDAENEAIAVKEANTLNIPIVAVVDTNCDPDNVDFVIPGNDDALRSVKLFTSTVADAVEAGRSIWDARMAAEKKAQAKKAAEEKAAAQLKAEEKAKKAEQLAEKKKAKVPPQESKAAPEARLEAEQAEATAAAESAEEIPADKQEKEQKKKAASRAKETAVRSAPVIEEEVESEAVTETESETKPAQPGEQESTPPKEAAGSTEDAGRAETSDVKAPPKKSKAKAKKSKAKDAKKSAKVKEETEEEAVEAD